jgi:hypothetical protein
VPYDFLAFAGKDKHTMPLVSPRKGASTSSTRRAARDRMRGSDNDLAETIWRRDLLIDPAHSSSQFSDPHMMISNVHGGFVVFNAR